MASKIQIENQSDSQPRVAIYQKSFRRPSLGLVAWRIAAPPLLGYCDIVVPSSYEVSINWGDPADAGAGCHAPPMPVDTFSARFNVLPTSTDDNVQTIPRLVRVDNGVNPNEIDIANQSGQWVWGHITKDGDDVYEPQIVTPGETLMADVRPTYYLAIVSEFVRKGDRLVDAEHSQMGIAILPGQRAVITGSRLEGFAIDVT